MAKPSITKRITKSAALTYSELDTNFQNLADATLTLRAGTGGTNVTADLNGTITLVAGTNVTLTGDNTAKTITVNATGGGGSGTVNTGVATSLAYYPSNGTTIADIPINYYSSTGIQGLQNTGTNTFQLANVNGSTYINLNNDGTISLNSDNVTLGDGSGTVSIKTNSNQVLNLRTAFVDSTAITLGNAGIINTYGILQVVGTSIIVTGAGGNASVTTDDSGTSLYLNTNDGLGPGGQILLTAGTNGGITMSASGTGNISLTSGLKLLSTASAPSSPTNGMIYYNNSTHKFQGYANGAWVDLH